MQRSHIRALRTLLATLIVWAPACAGKHSPMPEVALDGATQRPAASYTASPPFEDYPAAAEPVAAPKGPKLSSPMGRRYRTLLRRGAAEGPNFNGHYRVVTWGCGTNCLDWAIVDLEKGNTWFPEDEATSCWAPGKPRETSVPDWINIRLNSSLLVLHECKGPSAPVGYHAFDTRRLFVWRGDRLEHLRDEPLSY